MNRVAPKIKEALPTGRSAALAVLSAILLTLSFPDFNLAPLAWFGAVPLMVAVSFERDSAVRSGLVGWLAGTLFFFGTCWWLTFAPITYAGMSWPIAYFLLLLATTAAGFFIGVFCAVLGSALKRFGDAAVFISLFAWPAAEFARYWITGNNWNALGYSQAFVPGIVWLSSLGGVYVISFAVITWNALIAFSVIRFLAKTSGGKRYIAASAAGLAALAGLIFALVQMREPLPQSENAARVTVVQPNVPMNGMNEDRYATMLALHIRESSSALKDSKAKKPADVPSLIVFPESPMMFMWGEDPKLRELFTEFAAVTESSLLFNSAEKSEGGGDYHNSAVMIDRKGKLVAQYDKIFLLPFGEFIPFPEPVASWMPAFVGSFRHGSEYDLLPIGDLKAGVMICFESHFGSHTAEYARRGADVIIEMTNDGYLGNTPVLRQHLANSVMRAAETRRPVIRATNVGVTAYIDGMGEILEEAPVYTDLSRSWLVPRSDGVQTLYVRFGDWFAWLCSMFTLGVIFVSLRRWRAGRTRSESADLPGPPQQ